MKKFNYHIPNNLNQSYKIFKDTEYPQYLAGGMTLLPSMKQGLSQPSDIIDITLIEDLKGIYEDKNFIKVGAMNSHNDIASNISIKKNLPGLSYLASKIADNAVRNKGTLGGSICNADPAADYPAALISLDAKIITNLREIESKDFFVDMFETNLEEGEILKSVLFSKKAFSCYEKFANQASKYAIAGVFTSAQNDLVSIAITGVSNKAFLLNEMYNLNLDKAKKFNLDEINFKEYDINSDINGSADYKISLIKTLIRKNFSTTFYE